MRFLRGFWFLILVFLPSLSYGGSVEEYIDRGKKGSSVSYNSAALPYAEYDLKTDLFYNYAHFDSLEATNTDFSALSTLDIDLHLNAHFYIRTEFELAKVGGSGYNMNNIEALVSQKGGFLLEHGVAAKSLAAVFAFERIEVSLGKIRPLFGAGHERWSDYFNNDWYGAGGTFANASYKLDDKIGLMFDVMLLDEEYSKIRLNLAGFTNDDSLLFTEPAFSHTQIIGFVVPSWQGYPKRIAGSSSEPKSHSIALEGFFGLTPRDVLSFNFGYRKQYHDRNIEIATVLADEQAASVALGFSKIFFDDLVFSSFAEGVRIWHAYGVSDNYERYITAGAGFDFIGLKLGYVGNYYENSRQDVVVKNNIHEYYIGFQVPKTSFAVYGAKRIAEVGGVGDFDGFSISMRYRLK